MQDGQAPGWQERFPPAAGLRTYMMDVTASDQVALPDLRPLLAGARGLPPLTSVAAADWEPVAEGTEAPAAGMVLPAVLMVSPGVEINEGGRTPCREEHLIVVACAGSDQRSPVVVCPLILAETLTTGRHAAEGQQTVEQMRAGERRGVIPALLPRAGYDTVAQVFISLLQPQAIMRMQAASALRAGQVSLQLNREATARLQSALLALR